MMKIIVKAESGGLEKAMTKLEGQSRAAAAMTASMREDFLTMARASATISQNMKAATRGTVGGVGGGRAIVRATMKAPPRLSPAAIVNQMGIQGAISQYGGAAMAGNPFAARVVNAAQNQQRSIARAQNFLNPQQQDPMQMIMQAIMRTRFMQQGSKMVGMPLGIDIAKLLGSGQGAALKGIMGGASLGGGAAAGGAAASLAAIALPAAAVAGAFVALVAATKLTMQAMDQARQNLNRSGGNASQAGVLRGVGLDARGLVDSAMGSGLGRMELARAGGSLIPRELGGNLDSTQAAMKLIEAVRRAPSDQAARVLAERLGNPDLLDARRYSQDQINRLNRMNPAGIEAGAEGIARFNLELEMLKANLTGVGSPLMELTKFATSIIKLGNLASEAFNKMPDWVKKAISGAPGGGIPALVNELMGNDPQNRTAKATERMARTLDAIYREGISGGGTRTARAIPDRWMGTDKLEGTNNLRDLRLGIL